MVLHASLASGRRRISFPVAALAASVPVVPLAVSCLAAGLGVGAYVLGRRHARQRRRPGRTAPLQSAQAMDVALPVDSSQCVTRESTNRDDAASAAAKPPPAHRGGDVPTAAGDTPRIMSGHGGEAAVNGDGGDEAGDGGNLDLDDEDFTLFQQTAATATFPGQALLDVDDRALLELLVGGASSEQTNAAPVRMRQRPTLSGAAPADAAVLSTVDACDVRDFELTLKLQVCPLVRMRTPPDPPPTLRYQSQTRAC
jgi:hypothetical protein